MHREHREHLGDPAGALRRMAGALRRGGWQGAEEPDDAVAEAVDRAHSLAEVFDSCNKRIEFTSPAGITDLRFGKVLSLYLDALGLVEKGNEGVARVAHGGDPLSRMWIQTWQRIDDVVIAEGILTESEVADMRRAYQDRHSLTARS